MIYCVTVDETTFTEEIWEKYETEILKFSDVDGGQFELGTIWNPWVATVDREKAKKAFDYIAKITGFDVGIDVEVVPDQHELYEIEKELRRVGVFGEVHVAPVGSFDNIVRVRLYDDYGEWIGQYSIALDRLKNLDDNCGYDAFWEEFSDQ